MYRENANINLAWSIILLYFNDPISPKSKKSTVDSDPGFRVAIKQDSSCFPIRFNTSYQNL